MDLYRPAPSTNIVAQSLHPIRNVEEVTAVSVNRINDKKVQVSVPNIHAYSNNTPVLVDDIISTARTMIETVKHLQSSRTKRNSM